MRLFLLILFLLITSLELSAKELLVRNLDIQGNNKTKQWVILREIDILPGSTIAQENISHRLEINKQNLINTGIFSIVDINITNWDHENSEIDINITVTESWYIYPSIIFQLADRNFNQWWVDHNHSLKRVNAGIIGSHVNLTGNRDKLKVKAHMGFTQKVELFYSLPLAFTNGDYEIFLSFFLGSSKEIAIRSEGNKQIFESNESENLLNRVRVSAGATKRKGIYIRHSLVLSYYNNKIPTWLPDMTNPDFFGSGNTHQRYFQAEFQFNYDNRRPSIFPVEGVLLRLTATKEGLGIFNDLSRLSIAPNLSFSYRFNEYYFTTIKNKSRLFIQHHNGKDPYFNYQALGYGDGNIRGYEYYVMDGSDYTLFQGEFVRKIINNKITLPVPDWAHKFKNIPFRIYLGLQGDLGYVKDEYYSFRNPFVNRWLFSGGLGLNIIVYQNFHFSVDYSVNHLGKGGLYLHFNTSY